MVVMILDCRTATWEGCAAQIDAVERQLIAIDRKWEEARVRADTAALAGLLADDFIHIDEKGEVTSKEDRLQRLAARSGMVEASYADEYRVRVYGTFALMTHRSTEGGRQSRSTHVFVCRGNHWQVVAHHSSFISSEP